MDKIGNRIILEVSCCYRIEKKSFATGQWKCVAGRERGGTKNWKNWSVSAELDEVEVVVVVA